MYEKGDYEKAAEKYFISAGYNDSDEKWKSSLDQLVKTDREKWLRYLDVNSFEVPGEQEAVANILCYLGKPKKYVLDNAEFIDEDSDVDYNKNEYVCAYELRHDWNFMLEYIELEFDENGSEHNLKRISFYGDSDSLNANNISGMIGQDYDSDDNEAFDSYTWNISNDLLSEVYFNGDGYCSVEVDGDTRYCTYKLSFINDRVADEVR